MLLLFSYYKVFAALASFCIRCRIVCFYSFKQQNVIQNPGFVDGSLLKSSHHQFLYGSLIEGLRALPSGEFALTYFPRFAWIKAGLERWLSGRKRLPAKKVSPQKGLRGFKSLPLRQKVGANKKLAVEANVAGVLCGKFFVKTEYWHACIFALWINGDAPIIPVRCVNRHHFAANAWHNCVENCAGSLSKVVEQPEGIFWRCTQLRVWSLLLRIL